MMRDMEEKTALVVEDHSEHYKRYAALLSGMGLRVERACDGIGDKTLLYKFYCICLTIGCRIW